MQHYVTEAERWSVINGMRTAADACINHAEALREGEDQSEGNLRLAAQFESQAVEYRRIAVVAEVAESAVIEYDADEMQWDSVAEQARVERQTARIRPLADSQG